MTIRPLLALPRRLKEAFSVRRNRRNALLALVAASVAQVGAFVFFPPWVEIAYAAFQVTILMPLAVLAGAAGTPKRSGPLERLMSQDNAENVPFLLAASAHLYTHCRNKREGGAALKELAKELAHLRTEQEYLPEIATAVGSHCVWAVCGRKTDDVVETFWKANAMSRKAGNTIERIFIPPRNADEERSLTAALARHFDAGMTIRAFDTNWKGSNVLFKWRLPEGFGMTLVGKRPSSPDHQPDFSCVLVHWGYIGEQVPHHGVILKSPQWTAHFWGLFQQMAIHAQPTTAASLPQFLESHPNYVLARARASDHLRQS
jgi:hypothetical protein